MKIVRVDLPFNMLIGNGSLTLPQGSPIDLSFRSVPLSFLRGDMVSG